MSGSPVYRCERKYIYVYFIYFIYYCYEAYDSHITSVQYVNVLVIEQLV